jgi:hypothetical protein
MKKLLKLGLAVLAVVVFGRATCGPHGGASVKAVAKLVFIDHVYYHNMGITWDGENYYTINGGNAESSVINKYDEQGALVESYDIGVDGRAIFYRPAKELLYLKQHGKSLENVDPYVQVTNTVYPNCFIRDQSSAAMSPDGDYLYELYDGRVDVIRVDVGDEVASFALSSHSEETDLGYAYAIAASDKFLFVWAPKSNKDILVYDLDGKYVTKFSLPRAGYGFSLSWANDMLWIAEDADGGEDGADGTWFGYALEGLE